MPTRAKLTSASHEASLGHLGPLHLNSRLCQGRAEAREPKAKPPWSHASNSRQGLGSWWGSLPDCQGSLGTGQGPGGLGKEEELVASVGPGIPVFTQP